MATVGSVSTFDKFTIHAHTPRSFNLQEVEKLQQKINSAFLHSINGQEGYSRYSKLDSLIADLQDPLAQWHFVKKSPAESIADSIAGVIYQATLSPWLLKNHSDEIKKLSDSKNNMQNYAYFGTLWVSPDYKSQGLGKKLITFIEEKAKEDGKKHLIILVDKATTLPSYYHKQGYQGKWEDSYYCYMTKAL